MHQKEGTGLNVCPALKCPAQEQLESAPSAGTASDISTVTPERLVPRGRPIPFVNPAPPVMEIHCAVSAAPVLGWNPAWLLFPGQEGSQIQAKTRFFLVFWWLYWCRSLWQVYCQNNSLILKCVQRCHVPPVYTRRGGSCRWHLSPCVPCPGRVHLPPQVTPLHREWYLRCLGRREEDSGGAVQRRNLWRASPLCWNFGNLQITTKAGLGNWGRATHGGETGKSRGG